MTLSGSHDFHYSRHRHTYPRTGHSDALSEFPLLNRDERPRVGGVPRARERLQGTATQPAVFDSVLCQRGERTRGHSHKLSDTPGTTEPQPQARTGRSGTRTDLSLAVRALLGLITYWILTHNTTRPIPSRHPASRWTRAAEALSAGRR